MIVQDHEYHGVELVGRLPEAVYNWCHEKYGAPNGDRWYTRHNMVYFYNKLDHMMFLMRWG